LKRFGTVNSKRQKRASVYNYVVYSPNEHDNKNIKNDIDTMSYINYEGLW